MASTKVYRTSVNVKYDIGVESLIKNYLATPSHAQSIIGLSKGFIDKKYNSAHIMIGPYGSGKSLLSTIIGDIVGKRVQPSLIDDLIVKFDKVHEDTSKSLLALKNIKEKQIIIALNGKYNDFGNNLIEEIQMELVNNGIEVNLSTEKNNILSTIRLWKNEFPHTYSKLIEILDKRNVEIDFWIRKITESDKNEMDWFKEIYPELTSGAKFNSNINGDFRKDLKEILNVLNNNNIGLFIIHDEFGRFLQTIPQENIYKTMQDIQDLAEFSNRSNNKINVLFVSHRTMSQYMIGFSSEFQAEFSRIEERYENYYVDSDTATYYRIVEQHIDNLKLDKPDVTQLDKTLKQVRPMSLFPELNQYEIENLLLKGSYPIHPITLYLLPKVSKIFGQNERTLFSYLTAESSNGFLSQLDKKNYYIYADSLFNFFFSNEIIENYYDERTKSILQKYISISSQLDARKGNAYRIIKFITLWELTNSNNVYKIDGKLLESATGIENSRLNQLLEELIDLKFIRYNLVQEYWELAEGSSLIIEDLIMKSRSKVKINMKKRIDFLNDINPKKYYLGRDYNYKKNMTRFMRVQLINSTKFISKANGITLDEVLLNKSDGTINIIILDNHNDYSSVTDKIKEFDSENILFAIYKKTLNEPVDILDNYIIINELLDDTNFLAEYNNLKAELNIVKEDYHYQLLTYLEDLLDFTDQVEWFYQTEKLTISDTSEMESTISEIMEKLYRDTPIIMNDSVNRYNVDGIQLRSLYSLIDNVINTPFNDNIGITGKGPDYLIYATLFKNNNVIFNDLDNLTNPYYSAIRNDLISYLENNPKGSLYELKSIIIKKPYGIRPMLAPLLIVSLLRDKWSQLMFYSNEVFIPALIGEKVYEMFDAASDYDYVFHNHSEQLVDFLNHLERRISDKISEYVAEDTLIIKISSGLLNWLRSLPRQVQISNNKQTKFEVKLKELIRRSEIDPLASIESISELFNYDYNQLYEIMNQLENSFDKFKKEMNIEFLSLLEIKSYVNKQKFIDSWDEIMLHNNGLLQVLNNSNDFDQFIFNYIGTEIENWSDLNAELFIKQIHDDISELNLGNIDEEDIIEINVAGKHQRIPKVELSQKSTIIYNNVDRIISNAGRNIPQNELNTLLVNIVKKYLE